jgi:hypothetical protein
MLLQNYGYLWIDTNEVAGKHRRIATPGPLAPRVTGAASTRRRIAPQKAEHHIRTLDALTLLEASLVGGWRVVEVETEPELRRVEQAGRFLRKGDAMSALPDAVMTVEGVKRGVLTRLRVAVEYVTTKYSDADILHKHRGFASFDNVVWVADRRSTADRVRRLTGRKCSVLP